MKRTQKKILRNILMISLLGLWLVPLSAYAEEGTSVKSGENDIGIEFTEDYVPREPPVQPKPDPPVEPKPQPKPNPPRPRLPQTGETATLKSTMFGVLIISAAGLTYLKRREKSEKK